MAANESLTVKIGDAASRIRVAFKHKRPVFIWGPPGVGKSDIIAQITNELGGYMIDLRLGQMEPTDIRGIPFYNRESGKMDWAPPIELPDEELASQYPVVVLFLDEMNTAAPAVQAAGYQLILNRRVGKYKLPDNVVIVAAGNRESDKGVTYRMPSPLANRFVHLEVTPDFGGWFDWAVANSIHQDVVGYLSHTKSDLFNFNPRDSGRSFATPRSWAFVSQFLKDDNADELVLRDLIAGTVGEGVMIKFMAHRKIASQLPAALDILQGKVKDLQIKELSAQYSLAISLCYELQEQLKKGADPKKPSDEWHKMANTFFVYMMANFSQELTVMGARIALTTYNLPMLPGKMGDFNEFHKRFGKFIVAASAK